MSEEDHSASDNEVEEEVDEEVEPVTDISNRYVSSS